MSKFQKGTFIILPNKEILRGQSPDLQAIYLWLCDYADEYGRSFPSRSLLAKVAGVSIKSLDKHLKILVSLGILSKENRVKDGEKLSNLYQIKLKEVVAPKTTLPSPQNDPTPSPQNDPLTQPIILTQPTNPMLSDKPNNDFDPIFDYPRELFILKNSNQKTRKIIALYFYAKGWQFENKIQFDQAVKRELRPATSLKGYSGSQIQEAIDFCEKEYTTWTLETVEKRIKDLVLSKK